MKNAVVASAFLCATMVAAQSQTAKVARYIPFDAGGKQVFILQLQGNVSGGCNTTGRFAIDSSLRRFKSAQAAVMAAFHTQTQVTVSYAQTCNACQIRGTSFMFA
jgi:hypothetical protein